jgi:hypothetical protein
MKASLAAFTLLLIVAGSARAQMVPDKDLRELRANAYWNAIPPDLHSFVPGFFEDMDTSLDAFTEDGMASGAGANANQRSIFLPNRIDYNGITSGYWAGDPSGHYDALSLAHLRVQIPTCVEYQFYGSVTPMDGAGYVEVRNGLQKYLYVDNGELTQSGRLPSGTYDFEARSDAISSVQNMDGAIWLCQACGTSNIATQPGDRLVPWDTTATYCVTPTTASGTTYQWRKNLAPLSNSAHITGATSSCLSILHVDYPDTGSYDVVVTTGSVVEPSRLAHLGISTTGIEGPPSALRSFALESASPNPSAASISCRFVAPEPFRASIVVFDVSGRRVRRFADRVLAGSGVLVWDGRTEEGSLAAPGIYFLRVMAKDESRIRRVALVR